MEANGAGGEEGTNGPDQDDGVVGGEDSAEDEQEDDSEQQEEQNEAGGERRTNTFTFDTMAEFCRSDPSRMVLTAQERTWALAIKAAIESSDEIDNLPDFDYAQLALVDNDNVQSALDRAQCLQQYKEQYSIRNSMEDGNNHWRSMVNLAPDLILSLAFFHELGCYMCVTDLARISEYLFTRAEDNRLMFGLAFYLGHTLSPDFSAIRNGIFLVAECEG